MFENAKWICRTDSEKALPAPLLRKSFYINKPIKKAVLNVCGLGLGEYYINGKKVSDQVLITPYTKYDSTTIYTELDVTDYLSAGNNAIGAVLGNGCYFVTKPRWDVFKPAWMHHPKLILQLDIEFSDNTYFQVNSDRTWVTKDSPIIYNETKHGETYDARLETKSWNMPDIDETDWSQAIICRGAGGILKKQVHPPIRITHEFKAKKISDTVYDLGQNISGWVKFKASGKKGTELKIQYAECLKDDGSPNFEQLNTNLGCETHTDTYIFKGEGTEKWAPRFVYHGFRYFEVTNAPSDFEAVGQMVHTDLDIIGEFECSDEILNSIHHMTRMSTLTNFHGVPTDCPQREQNGWTGDALLSAEQSIMNYDMTESYLKWLDDIVDFQRPNGQIPSVVPTAGWGYNWSSGPAWDSFLIQCPYYIYNFNGDLRAIRKMWTPMKKYMDFMASMTDDFIQSFGLGDWCPPKNAPETPLEITDTAYYYINAKAMIECGRLLGKDVSEYIKLADNIKKAFRNRFVKDGIVTVKTQTAVACAIYQGLLEPEEIPENARLLNSLLAENNYNTTCGILGNKYIYSALSENGYAESLYKMVTNPNMPSFAYWVMHGMTTLCENWDMSYSQNHHMYSEVDMWFYKHIAGIKISDGGKKIEIAPCFIKELDWVRANHRNISVYWNKEYIEISSDRDFTLTLNNKSKKYPCGKYRIAIKNY